MRACRLADSHLVVIDPQSVFADPASQWCADGFDAAMAQTSELAPLFGERVLVTRWLPTADRATAWRDYFERWPFADVAADDPLFDLVPAAQDLLAEGRRPVDRPTFGKWGRELADLIGVDEHVADWSGWTKGPGSRLVLTGVATDCCVIATALAAADAGVFVTVVSDGCAGSSRENHERALALMELSAPLIEVSTAAQVRERMGQ
ncbi:isochorismatase family protein [Brevibacterium sp. 5221]|uniref:Isochorismatase family protein n=1 Tax=Brevibacterium rongguiense TaxID=2695267 RepID=A0A6N9H9E7_9MICO|nr:MULTISPECIES: isochorismatase family protein [Brevibacterium]MYM20595.1 isochorismatase family protein [Brevibacterium rongguiense]WAL39288.1 isochorismatase family protein [Brevibacterium sp. BRM-1]